MKYILLLLFTISILAGCGTTQNSVQEPVPEEKPEQLENTVEKPEFIVIKYNYPVVVRETRKYHTGDIDVYKKYEYEKNTDILVSCTTYDSGDEILEYIKTEKTENSEKHLYFNSSNELLKTKLIEKDSSGNITEVSMLDSSNNQISRSEYEYSGSLKTKWNIFDSNNALLAYNTYSYDKEGNNTEIRSFSPTGSLEEYFIHEIDNDGNITSVKHYDSKDNLITSSRHIFENSLIKEELFYKGAKALQRKKAYSYSNDNTVQTCEVSVTGGQIVEIIEKEFYFIEKEKTIKQ